MSTAPTFTGTRYKLDYDGSGAWYVVRKDGDDRRRARWWTHRVAGPFMFRADAERTRQRLERLVP